MATVVHAPRKNNSSDGKHLLTPANIDLNEVFSDDLNEIEKILDPVFGDYHLRGNNIKVSIADKQGEKVLELKGTANSYYQRQMAQELIRPIATKQLNMHIDSSKIEVPNL